MTKQALRRKKRMDEILASAVRAFRQRGYHGTSMDSIADELLMTKGSLYYYFKDKEDILFAIHDRALDHTLAELERVRGMDTCACQRLEALVAAHIQIMVEGFYGTGLALEFGALSAARLKKIIAKRDRYELGLRELIEEGIRTGCLREVDPKLAGFAVFGAINWIARWYRPGGPSQPAAVAQSFLDLFMGGLRAKPAGAPKAHRPAPSTIRSTTRSTTRRSA